MPGRGSKNIHLLKSSPTQTLHSPNQMTPRTESFRTKQQTLKEPVSTVQVPNMETKILKDFNVDGVSKFEGSIAINPIQPISEQLNIQAIVPSEPALDSKLNPVGSKTIPSFSGPTCNSTIHDMYNTADSNSDSLKWCIQTRNEFHVVIGKSWGGLNKAMQNRWDTENCNE